jgi:tRNA dimethylallyltransferase
MLEDGLEEEARGFYPMRHLNSLNTVGYKELFNYFDGNCSKEFAIDKIKQHSRNYARKQLSWFRRDEDIFWINLSKSKDGVVQEIINLL